jgi:hypothetical protein
MMKKCTGLALLFGTTCAWATPPATAPLLKQNLVAVSYNSDGKQTGCGLRATGESKEHLSLNALFTVFLKETGATFGVVKVVVRKSEIKNGKAKFIDMGRISKTWVQSDSAAQPKIYTRGTAHNDGYMETVDYADTVQQMTLLAQENFRIGVNFNTGQADQVFVFDQWMDRREGNAFAACMSNLTNVIEESKKKRSL